MLFGSYLFITSSLASSSRAGATIGMELESKNGILRFSPIRLSMRRGGHGTGGGQSSSPSHGSRGLHAMRAQFKSALIGPYLDIPGCTFAELEKMPHSGHTTLSEHLFWREFFILLLILTPSFLSVSMYRHDTGMWGEFELVISSTRSQHTTSTYTHTQ
jgi:hypothetical protein